MTNDKEPITKNEEPTTKNQTLIMHIQDIHTLYEYNYWANHRILGVVETLTPEQFAKNLGSSHGGIQSTLVHIMGAEEIWLRRWKGTSPTGFAKPEDYGTFRTLKQHWNVVEHEMMDFVHSLTADEDIRKVIEYKDMKGNAYSRPLYQLMQHLVNHSTYHRGQVVAMLRQSGVEPVGTDLIMFYREKA